MIQILVYTLWLWKKFCREKEFTPSDFAAKGVIMDFMVYLYIQGARGEFCCLVVKPGPAGAFLSQRRWTAITMGSFRYRSARAALADRPFKRECSFLSHPPAPPEARTLLVFFVTRAHTCI